MKLIVSIIWIGVAIYFIGTLIALLQESIELRMIEKRRRKFKK